tara:strand:+ start:49 stop:216 length:168 start_codon:yes stop_codon:yes gene_type:complete
MEIISPKIENWKLVITWNDGTTEDVVDVPKVVATEIDLFLEEIEQDNQYEEVWSE